LSTTTNFGHYLILLSLTCSNLISIYTSICDCLLFYSTITQHNEMPLAKTSKSKRQNSPQNRWY